MDTFVSRTKRASFVAPQLRLRDGTKTLTIDIYEVRFMPHSLV